MCCRVGHLDIVSVRLSRCPCWKPGIQSLLQTSGGSPSFRVVAVCHELMSINQKNKASDCAGPKWLPLLSWNGGTRPSFRGSQPSRQRPTRLAGGRWTPRNTPAAVAPISPVVLYYTRVSAEHGVKRVCLAGFTLTKSTFTPRKCTQIHQI